MSEFPFENCLFKLGEKCVSSLYGPVVVVNIVQDSCYCIFLYEVKKLNGDITTVSSNDLSKVGKSKWYLLRSLNRPPGKLDDPIIKHYND